SVRRRVGQRRARAVSRPFPDARGQRRRGAGGGAGGAGRRGVCPRGCLTSGSFSLHFAAFPGTIRESRRTGARTEHVLVKPAWISLSLLLALALSGLSEDRPKFVAREASPPDGFTALFNGKDTTGWHGMPHTDPYKLAALSEDDRKAQIAKWTEDALKHCKAQNTQLVNHDN